jgi:hypothetical protein
MPDASLNAHAAVGVIAIDLRVVSIIPHLKIEIWGTHYVSPLGKQKNQQPNDG